MSSVSSSLGLSKEAKKGQQDNVPMALVVVAVLLLVAPCDLSQLLFAFTGVVICLLVAGPKSNNSKGKSKKKYITTETASEASVTANSSQALANRAGGQQSARTAPAVKEAVAQKGPEYRKLSSNPVAPPTFNALGYEAEVEELLSQIAPSTQGDKVVQQLARRVERTLKAFIPEAEVIGFASGDLTRGTAFGVAVPEVDIVVNVSPAVLCTRMQGRLSLGASAPEGKQSTSLDSSVDERKLQKSAIRACTDRLVAQGGFKFRRSAFRGQEPKVTLLAPVTMGIHSEAIPIDFSVNIMTPLYNATLLAECGRIAPPAKALILMVKRWAKDRGVCHAAKGHLSPYAWSLATIFFLQVGVDEALYPPFEGFVNSSGQAVPSLSTTKETGKWTKSTAQLFKDFIAFFAGTYDWETEVLSVRSACRQQQNEKQAPLSKEASSGEECKVSVHIEDPFEPSRNLGTCMTEVSFGRLQEELARAADMCARDASLTELLAPWVPPERCQADGKELDEN